MNVSKIIFACGLNIELCGPLEVLAEVVIMCKEEMEKRLIIKIKITLKTIINIYFVFSDCCCCVGGKT